MLSLLAVAVATAAGIVVPSDQNLTCPTANQVESALRARLPDVVGETATRLTAPLWLQWRGSVNAPEVQLRDARGQVVLSRVLRLQTGAAADCVALAETVALIVERYLDELQVEQLERVRHPVPSAVPAPVSPPETAWEVGVRTLVRSGRGHWLPPGGEAWVERAAGLDQWRVFVGALAGVAGSQEEALDGASLNRLQTWLLVRGGAWRVWGSHRLGLAAAAGLAAVRASIERPSSARSAWGAEPWVGVAGRYRFTWGDRWFAEAGLGVYAAVVRHDLVVRQLPSNERLVVASTPRIFTDVGLALGLQF